MCLHSSTARTAAAVSFAAVVFIVGGAALLGVMIRREKKGNPMFKQWESQATGVQHI